MISTDNICMSCMREIGESKQCPYCGYHVDSAQIPPYLPVRTLLSNRYLVGKLLDYNSEGATYIGWDINQKKPVSIREFFPVSIAMRTTADPEIKVMPSKEMVFRDCIQSFSELWNKLMDHRGLAALINVTDVFSDLGTLYAVYDYVEGVTLREYLLSSKNGYLSWDMAKQLLLPVLSTLGNLHSLGIIHRGISPATLIVGRDNKVRITGFSIGQARTAKGDLDAQLYPGYAAYEQYGVEERHGSWTDVYSFGAVLYRALIGNDPIDAAERAVNDRLMVPGKFAELLPESVINGLINSLQVMPEDRTRTAEQLKAELTAGGEEVVSAFSRGAGQQQAAAQSGSKPAKQSKGKKQGGAKTGLIAALVTILAGALIFGGFCLFAGDKIGLKTPSFELTTSAGEGKGEMTDVPNFSEKNYLDVTSNPVFKENFQFEVRYVFDDKISKNYIVGQSVNPSSQVPKGSAITLFVSKGKEQIELPDNLIGAKFEDVDKRLKELGFVVIEKPVDNGEGYDDGTVTEVAPVPGQAYDKGTEVTVKVYRAPETTAPDETQPGISDFPLEEPDFSEYYEDIEGGGEGESSQGEYDPFFDENLFEW